MRVPTLQQHQTERAPKQNKEKKKDRASSSVVYYLPMNKSSAWTKRSAAYAGTDRGNALPAAYNADGSEIRSMCLGVGLAKRVDNRVDRRHQRPR